MKNRKIRYAVVGLGHIAQTAILPGFKHAKKNSELAALVSDDPVKLQKLGDQYDVPLLSSYEDYEMLLRSGLIDAVYVCTPNSRHVEFARKAVANHIHVLCEKPLSNEVKQASSIVKFARRKKVKLMTAYRLHFDPANLDAMIVAKSGKLGDLRFFSSTFSFQIRDKSNIRLNEKVGGGTLFDIGIYCINAARYLFQAQPYEVFANSFNNHQARFSEVDEMTSVMMRFPNERVANFVCSFGAADTSQYEIVGTKGKLTLKQAYEYAAPMEMKIEVGEHTSKKTYPKHDQFAPEIEYFSECIVNKREPEPSGVEGLIDVQIIDALLRSIKSGKPESIRTADKKIYARPSQRKIKPGISRPPRGVHVQGPH